jgi:hypothetical protein
MIGDTPLLSIACLYKLRACGAVWSSSRVNRFRASTSHVDGPTHPMTHPAPRTHGRVGWWHGWWVLEPDRGTTRTTKP